jgi:uncharacterized membrane protein
VVTLPAFPSHLSPEERRAVLSQAARDIAETAIREGQLDRAKALDTLTADAMASISISWLNERVAALEEAATAKKGTRK